MLDSILKDKEDYPLFRCIAIAEIVIFHKDIINLLSKNQEVYEKAVNNLANTSGWHFFWAAILGFVICAAYKNFINFMFLLMHLSDGLSDKIKMKLKIENFDEIEQKIILANEELRDLRRDKSKIQTDIKAGEEALKITDGKRVLMKLKEEQLNDFIQFTAEMKPEKAKKLNHDLVNNLNNIFNDEDKIQEFKTLLRISRKKSRN